MHKTLIEFFDNKVTSTNSLYILDYPLFRAMYGFISPIISYVDNMVIEDNRHYTLFLSPFTDIESIIRLLVESVTVVDHIEYRVNIQYRNGILRIELIGG